MLFGAHVSIAGGIFNAPLNAREIGCEVFQLFTRSPRGGTTPPLNSDTIKLFLANCKLSQQKEWYVHTPYFINFASEKKRVYYGSVNIIREELERASLLGAKYLMTHLGSYKDLGKKKGFAQLIEGLSQALKGYAGQTKFLIEIAAGAGEIIGHNFEDLSEIVYHPKLKKYDIGICYDTQHGFASNYDIRTPETVKKTLADFDNLLSLEKLKLSHINDSMVELGARKDRHAHIGEGKIGLKGFEALLQNNKLKNINFILETNHDKVREDLKKLRLIHSAPAPRITSQYSPNN